MSPIGAARSGIMGALSIENPVIFAHGDFQDDVYIADYKTGVRGSFPNDATDTVNAVGASSAGYVVGSQDSNAYLYNSAGKLRQTLTESSSAVESATIDSDVVAWGYTSIQSVEVYDTSSTSEKSYSPLGGNDATFSLDTSSSYIALGHADNGLGNKVVKKSDGTTEADDMDFDGTSHGIAVSDSHVAYGGTSGYMSIHELPGGSRLTSNEITNNVTIQGAGMSASYYGGATNDTVEIYEIANPSTVVHSFSVSNTNVWDITMTDDYFCLGTEEGVRVYDMSNANQLRLIQPSLTEAKHCQML